jgi:hypothetical protein
MSAAISLSSARHSRASSAVSRSPTRSVSCSRSSPDAISRCSRRTRHGRSRRGSAASVRAEERRHTHCDFTRRRRRGARAGLSADGGDDTEEPLGGHGDGAPVASPRGPDSPRRRTDESRLRAAPGRRAPDPAVAARVRTATRLRRVRAPLQEAANRDLDRPISGRPLRTMRLAAAAYLGAAGGSSASSHRHD